MYGDASHKSVELEFKGFPGIPVQKMTSSRSRSIDFTLALSRDSKSGVKVEYVPTADQVTDPTPASLYKAAGHRTFYLLLFGIVVVSCF